MVVEGTAFLDGDQTNSLTEFSDRLRESPLYEDVQLGSTSLAEIDGKPARRFELRLTPRRFPPNLEAVAVAPDTGGAP